MNNIKLLTGLSIGLLLVGGLIFWISGGDGGLSLVAGLLLTLGGIAFIGLILALIVGSNKKQG